MTSLQVRLVNGSSQYEGRVEVFYDNQWGTLCDDNFSYRGATVICRMLGLPTETATPHIGGHFPSGTGPIWMTDALCRGSEANIANCRYRGFDKNNVMNICMHSEDAGVTCA
ncbi:macrophage scavenger receptor types I and II-like, partial [Gigantopelta aegis]|uniref:macrophage scavenger receptor types I and II-like n=1 Tax=Gigantopelta aegis TaxID=1735272 RepID=UPI001B88C931